MKHVYQALSRALMLLAALHSIASAQIGPPMRRGPALERLEQYRKIRMMEVLKMDEQTSIRFFSRYNKHQEALRELRVKQSSMLEQIQALRKSDAGEAEYDKVIRDLRALEDKVNETKAMYLDELTDVLSKRQLAEYIVFEWRFQQNLRELLREMQREREERPMR